MNNSQHSASAGKNGKIYRLPAALLTLGLLAVIFMIAADYLNRKKRDNYLYTDVVHEMQIELSKARLILEERLQGKPGEDAGGMQRGLDNAEGLVNALLSGGSTLHGHTVYPLTDQLLRDDVKVLGALLQSFKASAQKAYDKVPAPQTLHTTGMVYHQFLDQAHILDNKFEEFQVSHEKRTTEIFYGLLLSWSILIAAAVIGLWYRETRGRKMHEAIVNAKSEWEHTFDVIPDLIALIDADHRIIRANRAMVEKMGAGEPRNILGKKCYELFHKTHEPLAFCPHARLLEDGRDHAIEFYEPSFKAFFLVSVSPLRDAAGRIAGSVHVARDITAQKENAKTMKIKDNAIRSSINAIVIVDLHGMITYVNPAFLTMWGYAEEEVPGRPVTLFAKTEAEAIEVMEAVSRDGGWTGERVGRKKDGTFFPVAMAASLVRDDTGNPLCMMASIIDITDRIKADTELRIYRENLEKMVAQRTSELASLNRDLGAEVLQHKHTSALLKDSEAQYRQLSQQFSILLDAIPDSLVLITPDLKVKWANRAALAVHGNKGSEETGGHCFALWHDQGRPCEDCPALKSFASGLPESLKISTPDGRLWALRTYPIMDVTGSVGAVMELGTDITEKVSRQSEQMRANHLASIGELAAGVAHEINNPINGIINYAQILLNKADRESREHDIAERIIREGDRIAAIVKGLLSCARERKEEKTPAYVGQILSDALALTEMQLKKNGIDLRIAVPSGLPPIIAHAQQIQQVFLNIINNARYALNMKYPQTDQDKVLLISGSMESHDGSEFVRMVFEDRGTGLPGHIMDKVMTPFFTTKPVGVGTGLGLSISHGIVTDHSGTITIESSEGEFTRVIIEFPAHTAQA